MAKWTEIDIYTGLVKNVDEDVPANFAGQGSKVALPPDLLMKKKKKLIDARTKVYRQHRERLEDVELLFGECPSVIVVTISESNLFLAIIS